MGKTYKQGDTERKIKRQQMVDDGAYDGRFMTRIVADKTKKKTRKKSTREYLQIKEDA